MPKLFFFAIQDSERKKRGRRSSFQAYILSLEESRVHFVYFVTLFTALLTSSCPAFRKCRCPQTPRRVRSSSRLVPFLPDHTDSPLLVKAPVHLFSCRMEQRPPPHRLHGVTLKVTKDIDGQIKIDARIADESLSNHRPGLMRIFLEHTSLFGSLDNSSPMFSYLITFHVICSCRLALSIAGMDSFCLAFPRKYACSVIWQAPPDVGERSLLCQSPLPYHY